MFGSKGLVQVYTGDGKGKTTAALGLALRASGHGAKVMIIEFMKGWPGYGELQALKGLAGITLVKTGREKCIFRGDETGEDFAEAARGLKLAQEALSSGEYDLVILDEASVAADFGLISGEELADIIGRRAEGTEVVVTGRHAPEELMAIADLITEMREICHPYQRGIAAREGVEF